MRVVSSTSLVDGRYSIADNYAITSAGKDWDGAHASAFGAQSINKPTSGPVSIEELYFISGQFSATDNLAEETKITLPLSC